VLPPLPLRPPPLTTKVSTTAAIATATVITMTATAQQELIHMQMGIIGCAWFCQNRIGKADTTIT
jgi:hypothetical protein